MSIARKFVSGAGLVAGGYGFWVRPRLMRCGVTDEEVAGLPGAGLVPEGRPSPAWAVTIDATPEQVWPWLIQMGWERGGWYSWDLLDNAGRPSATEVHPEWQDLAVGDMLKFWAFGQVVDAYRVAVLEPNRFLGLYGLADLFGRWLEPEQPRPSFYMEGIWSFQLKELPGGRTRLVVGGYQKFRPRWMERFYAEWVMLPTASIMSRRMMKTLKFNIERATTPEIPSRSLHKDEAIRSERLPATG